MTIYLRPDKLHDDIFLNKLNSNIPLNREFVECFNMFTTGSTLGMPREVFVSFINIKNSIEQISNYYSLVFFLFCEDKKILM